MFRLAWLLPVIFATGCASMQEKFCNLVEPDSYLLVSVAGCDTMQVSFDSDPETDFSALESYDWRRAMSDCGFSHSRAPRRLMPASKTIMTRCKDCGTAVS
jgi:hypothetical protein